MGSLEKFAKSKKKVAVFVKKSDNSNNPLTYAFPDWNRSMPNPFLTSPLWAARVMLGCPALWMAVGLSGCTSGPQPPNLSPEEVAAAALKQYDKNGDGFLAADELENCPALKSHLQRIDTNQDGKLSADEIAARLTKMKNANIARLGVLVSVKLDGEALPGATVRFVPETFMGNAVASAVGTTDQTGSADMKVEGSDKPGVQWGYYRIEVSKKDSDGKELLAERYNSKTTLGCEVSTDIRSSVVLKLSS